MKGGWSPSVPPNVKVNFDAVVDPLIAETKAALLVFKKMKEAGFKNIIF
uniref:Uncharacterized protein n=1 Tax=Fagus sylvatica TaxID=28930 RepID=A0A2N9GN97_FAGSY